MTLLEALGLGVLQGATEFLPISSSGHLVLAQSAIPGLVGPLLLFDVVVHLHQDVDATTKVWVVQAKPS